MRRAAELIAFLALSAMVHAGVMAEFGDRIGTPEAQGQGGADRITLAAAPESMAALARRWTEPPETATAIAALAPPPLPDAPSLPRLEPALSGLSLPSAPQVPQPDAPPLSPPMTTPPPPPAPDADTAVAQSPRPMARPAATSAPPSGPQAARLAQGQGGGANSGSAPTATTPAMTQAQRHSLMADWGVQIMARIERARPRVRGQGQVTLALRIGRDGSLAAISVQHGSGIAALDEAALSAVRRAGRFPPAPDGLQEASYAFTLPIRFR